jgi:hypothetical protein
VREIHVQAFAIVVAIVSFALVAGYAGLAWLKRGRDPSYSDDSSILTSAPPPAMTAATAVIVDGGPTRLAFTAALLDLASRDEIAFPEEIWGGYPIGVGIAIHGGETKDPQILLNRRKPVGEGEMWLLNQLRLGAAGVTGSIILHPSAAQIQADAEWWDRFAQIKKVAADKDEGPEAVAARQRGLFSGPPPEAKSLDQAYRRRTGRHLPESVRLGLVGLEPGQHALADPDAIARDPDGWARRLEAQSSKPLTAQQRESLEQWAALYSSAPPPGPLPKHISAAGARALKAPILFGPTVENYAKRHGWLAGLPVLQRLRWRLTGAAEIGLAAFLTLFFVWYVPDLVLGVAAGVAAGGLVTFLMAPAMTARTPAGAEMKAQLAAYRRTLQRTFSQARSMDEVVAARSLTWLETPDQALVWGVALGLQADIEALLARTANLLETGHGSAATYVPAWYTSAPVGTPTAGGRTAPEAVAQAKVMFAAIEAIGGGSGQAGSPARTAG